MKVAVGMTFGKWTVVRAAPKRKKHQYFYCRCVCGRTVKVYRGNLTRGKSGGCVNCTRRRTHGMSKSPEHTAFLAMHQRCRSTKSNRAHRYVGRSITVCAEWTGPGGFDRFYAHIGPKPGPEYSVDRINNDGNYEPGNVRWATDSQQMLNREPTTWITVNGQRRSLRDWATDLGTEPKIIWQRLSRGWTKKRAVTFPVSKSRSLSP